MQFKNIDELKTAIKENPDIKTSFSNDPEGFIDRLEVHRPIKDKGVFLIVVAIIGLVLLTAIVLSSMILFDDANNTNEVPDFLVAMASTALGALVGLLAPSPQTK